ncbi:MAG TPA: hypothetical protein VFC03_08610, partial [Acidimicrobiales bacterium]|nr:hypothetical protein [Acidimicrobiales bacterium]
MRDFSSRHAAHAAAVALIGLVVAGCGSTAVPEPTRSEVPATASGIAFVVGAHANEPVPVVDPAFT